MKFKVITILVSCIFLVFAYQNCAKLESNSFQTLSSSISKKCSSEKLSSHKMSTQSWFMEEVLENGNFSLLNSNPQIRTSHWMHDSRNGAHIGVNGWALGAKLIKDAHVFWEIEDSTGELALQWFMGGYNRDYNGKPQDGWWYNNQRGGNDVKAYPRIAIGSASGQSNASWGAPNVPSKVTNGVKHVDQELIREKVGIPARVKNLPKIDLNVDLKFSLGSNAVPAKDKYGNFFFAVDSYFHDIDTPEMQLDPSMAGTVNGINDSSGNIYGKDMTKRSVSSKRWAMMIWYGKSAYYETSGGKELAKNVDIGGIPHTIKYKLEDAVHHNFHYASFIMERDVTSFYNSRLQPTVTFNDYANFLSDGSYQKLLDSYMDRHGDLPGIDGVKRRIKAPTEDYVLSDVNLGVEILSNPDTPQDTSQKPVRINFKRLSFSVAGKGEFGFIGDPSNRTPASDATPIDPVPITEPGAAIDFPASNCSEVNLGSKYKLENGTIITAGNILYDNIDWPYVQFVEGGGESCDNRNRAPDSEPETPKPEEPRPETPEPEEAAPSIPSSRIDTQDPACP